MRKDRIEEKLADMDRELKSLRSAQAQGIESIIVELKQFQELLLEEKVAEIRAELSRESRDVALNSYMEDASVRLGESLPDPCPRDMRKTCRYIFQKRLEDAAQTLKEADGGDIVEATAAIARDDDERIGRLKTMDTCNRCYGMYDKEKDNLVKMMERFSSLKDDISARVVDDYIRQLPDDAVVSEIVDPLSHKARFRMLKSLSVGSMSYKELAEATGYDGGHLIYHLNRLIDAGLVIKDEAGGRYFVSRKGMGIMDLVKMLYYK